MLSENRRICVAVLGLKVFKIEIRGKPMRSKYYVSIEKMLEVIVTRY